MEVSKLQNGVLLSWLQLLTNAAQVQSCVMFPERSIGAWNNKCGRRKETEFVHVVLSPLAKDSLNVMVI